jgi:hypothetical protein
LKVLDFRRRPCSETYFTEENVMHSKCEGGSGNKQRLNAFWGGRVPPPGIGDGRVPPPEVAGGGAELLPLAGSHSFVFFKKKKKN